jgi:nucleoside-diphosphate-sugar epimerase
VKVFITGGTGKVGEAAVKRFVDGGYPTKVVGRRADIRIPGAEYAQCDINDYDTLVREMEGCDGVVHLAAIPGPAGGPGREVFRVNDLGTFNVFEAAATHGINRVVGASSINALGYFFGLRNFPIEYLPVDESHPTLATDAYSFSKQVMEDIGRYFWDREGISSVMLRLPAVWNHSRVEKIREEGDERVPGQREYIESILAMPDNDRREKMLELHEEYDRLRSTKIFEVRGKNRMSNPKIMDEQDSGLMHMKANLWAYLDDVDSAQAIEKGLIADYEGSHPLFINSHKNSIRMPIEKLAKLFHPEVTDIRDQFPGDDCLVSIDRARELLGFDPHFTI